VSQVFEAYDKFVVIKLGITFSALTMPDVLQRASLCLKGSHDIEEFVASLVMSNALRASLSHSSSSENTTMLRFGPTTRTRGLREEYVRARLIQTKHALNTIARGVIQTDRALGISNENLQFIVKNQTWNGNSEKSGAVGSCEADGGDVGDIDEDLMGNAY
jgi:COP9 signalosome complex subunit 3